jgi:hypothetical protein
MMRAGIIVLLLLASCKVMAQAPAGSMDKTAIIEQRVEFISENLTEETQVDYAELFDDLWLFMDKPLNLNTATLDDFSRLYLLTDIQINNLLGHIAQFGELMSMYELQVIPGFDRQTIALIEPFVTIKARGELSKTPLKKLVTEGQHDMIIRYRRVLDEQRGYSAATEEELEANPNARYLGSPDHLYARYRYTYANKISWGFVAEKDAGEQMFRGAQSPNLNPNDFRSGLDYLSGHLFLNNDKGLLRKLAIGDYQAQFGQGLTFWSGFAFANKSAFSLNIKRSARGLIPYTSVNENLFMRGAAATIGFGRIEITPFVSYKGIDASVIQTPDSLSEGDNLVSVSAFQQSGLHRTPREIEGRKALNELITGANVAYRSRNFQIGITGARVGYEGNVDRNLQVYNQFDLNTNLNHNIGLDYNYVWRNINLFGEVAMSQNGGMAILNGAMLAIDPKVSLSLLHRSYQRNYQNNFAVAIGESTRNANENGIYMGLEINPSRRIRINAFFDQFWFPWLRYQVDQPSTSGFDHLLQVTYRPSRKLEMYVRWRRRVRPRNTPLDVPVRYAESTDLHNGRISMVYQITESVKLRSRLEVSHFQRENLDPERGIMLYQDLIYQTTNSPFRLSLRYALFNAESWNARMYAFESQVLYFYAIPPYQGRGSRFYAMVQYKVTRGIDIWLRYGMWFYTDRDAVGTGLEEIAGPSRSEIITQVRFKF